MYIRYAYVVELDRGDSSPIEIIGICSTPYYADRHVEIYIKENSCPESYKFSIKRVKMDEPYSFTVLQPKINKNR